ncbi:hypothetical protein [Thermomonospora umbrina]|nr:hypothetical protein [Thermomonospora umbrina]
MAQEPAAAEGRSTLHVPSAPEVSAAASEPAPAAASEVGTSSASPSGVEPPAPDGDQVAAAGSARFRVRLPGFLVAEETGLGDVIKQATSSAGIKPCGGCGRRADALNRWVSVGPRRPG